MRVKLLDTLVRDFLNLNAESARHGSLAVDLFTPLFGQRNRDRTTAFEARGNTGFCFKLAVKFLGIFGQFRHVSRCTELRNQARCVPSCAGR